MHSSKTFRCMQILCILNNGYVCYWRSSFSGLQLHAISDWQATITKLFPNLRATGSCLDTSFGFSVLTQGLAQRVCPHSDYWVHALHKLLQDTCQLIVCALKFNYCVRYLTGLLDDSLVHQRKNFVFVFALFVCLCLHVCV